MAEQGLHSVKTFSASHTAPPASRLGVHKSWEGTELGQLTPTDLRDIPYLMIAYAAIKAEGQKEEGETLMVIWKDKDFLS